MSIHAVSPKARRRPSPQASKSTRLPAPYHGISSRDILVNSQERFCIYTYNLIPSQYGMSVRNGYREWCIGLETAPNSSFGVRTVIPFDTPDTLQDRLFATTNEGIWDCTIYNAPVLVYTFVDQSDNSGWGIYTHYVTSNAEDLLFLADSANGLFTYSPADDLWEQAQGISGIDVTKVNFVVNHKLNIWFVERDSATAWYLPNLSPSGTAKPFYFGTRFSHGGNLVGLFNWTIDGGEGVDDHLVAVSRSGDVIPYKGQSPDFSDTWDSVGVFFIGAVPAGNRCGTKTGADLYFLSAFGLISMSDLVRGVYPIGKNVSSTTVNITQLIRRDMITLLNERGWSVRVIPSRGVVYIGSPPRSGVNIGYVYSIVNEGWSIIRGLPVVSYDEWRGEMYFGNALSTLYITDVTVDNQTILPPIDRLNGDPIEFSILTTYTSLESPTQFKRGKYIRPDFITSGDVVQNCKFLYDYQIHEIPAPYLPPDSNDLEGLWDSSLWDQAVWVDSTPSPYNVVKGSGGMGRTLAVAMRGTTRSRTVFVAWDIIWDEGGPL